MKQAATMYAIRSFCFSLAGMFGGFEISMPAQPSPPREAQTAVAALGSSIGEVGEAIVNGII